MTADTLKSDIRSSFSDLEASLNIPGFLGFGNINEVVESYFNDLKYVDILGGFCELKRHSADHYLHSLRVGILSWMGLKKMGEDKNLDREVLAQYCIGGIFHDFGKLDVDKAILEKKGGLTHKEYEQIKQHYDAGDLIESVIKDGIDTTLVKYIAETHHNDLTGNGYGRVLDIDKFNGFTQLVAIADNIDAALFRGIYQKRCKPVDIQNYLDLISTDEKDKGMVEELTKQVSSVKNPDQSLYFKKADAGRFEKRYAEPYIALLRNYTKPMRR